jgi:hypothetical protein
MSWLPLSASIFADFPALNQPVLCDQSLAKKINNGTAVALALTKTMPL